MHCVFAIMNADSILLATIVTNGVISMRLRQIEVFNKATVPNADIRLYFSLFYYIFRLLCWPIHVFNNLAPAGRHLVTP